tara:strand:+ start:500 stop:1078 length:579 start_codon:yes stop_codon:yes gene_type:complete
MAQQAKIENYSGTEVIDLQEARNYLRVDHTDDNAYITELIKIARMQVVKDTNTAVVDLDVTEYFEKCPSDKVFQLRYSGKLGESGKHVKYYNSDNVLTTLVENTDYRFVNYMGMPKVEIIKSFNYYDRIDAIEIKYSVEPENTDETITLKMAMFLLIGHFYDNRTAVTFGSPKELPIGYKRIINQYKNYVWE